MKIYTKTGDDGLTGLFGGGRVSKNDVRVEAYGTIDELNSVLGVVRSLGVSQSIDGILHRLQNELFVLGAELSTLPGNEGKLRIPLLDEEDVARLEREIDEMEVGLPELRQFILPTGCQAGAQLHLARTICRRAERRFLDIPELRHGLVIYVNRLSDHLFVLARKVNQLAETPETPWSARNSV